MRAFHMFIIATTKPYIAQLATTPFKWDWDSNNWVPWMLHYPLWPPRANHPLIQLKLTKPPDSLSGSSTSTNRFRTFYRSPMPSTSNTMLNTRCHISFRWEKNFGCTCRKNALQGPIGSFSLSIMDLTSSPRMWVTIILRSKFPLSLAYSQCST
jgi:hypothetical protein